MRIIAGSAKGRFLAVLPGDKVRPTGDRVREALFSIVASQVAGARVLDLFAGSGALGLEALSRGAKSVVFVEQAAQVRRVLVQNIAAMPFADRASVIADDWSRALARLEEAEAAFDLVFLDPPYGIGVLEDCLERIAKGSLLAGTAQIVAEHESDRELPAVGGLQKGKVRRYGATSLSFFAFP